MGARAGWIAAAALGAVAGLAAAAGGLAAEERKVRFPETEPNLDRFLFLATLEGLCEEGIPDAAVEKALEKGPDGGYRNFVYACPICGPVVEGFRAYAMRRQIYHGRKGDPWVRGGGDLETKPTAAAADFAARMAAAEPKARGAALREFVERCADRRIERLRLTDREEGAWRIRFVEGRKKGMSVLADSKAFAHDSCPSCDGAAADAAPWK
jgi:hypothetical protein